MAADSRPAKSRVEVWRAFLEAHTLIVDQLERELTDERSLSLAWYDVLFQLSQAGGRLRMQDLAGRLLIPRKSFGHAMASDREVNRLLPDQEIAERFNRATPGSNCVPSPCDLRPRPALRPWALALRP